MECSAASGDLPTAAVVAGLGYVGTIALLLVVGYLDVLFSAPAACTTTVKCFLARYINSILIYLCYHLCLSTVRPCIWSAASASGAMILCFVLQDWFSPWFCARAYAVRHRVCLALSGTIVCLFAVLCCRGFLLECSRSTFCRPAMGPPLVVECTTVRIVLAKVRNRGVLPMCMAEVFEPAVDLCGTSFRFHAQFFAGRLHSLPCGRNKPSGIVLVGHHLLPPACGLSALLLALFNSCAHNCPDSQHTSLSSSCHLPHCVVVVLDNLQSARWFRL